MIGWGAVVFAIQSWLNETPAQLAGGKQPAYFGIGMACMSLLIVSFASERRWKRCVLMAVTIDVYADFLPCTTEVGYYQHQPGAACGAVDHKGL